MAEAARSIDYLPMDAVLPPAPTWSGDVHGPVAALHQAIEQGLAGRTVAWAPEAERPVDRGLRLASRATGWLVLTATFAGTALYIF